MKIIISEEPFTGWDAFLETQTDSLFYYSSAYIRLLCSVLGVKGCHLVALNDAGSICGLLPILYKDGPCGRVLNSQPFYGGHGGILAQDEAVWNALLNSYNELIKNVAASNLVQNPFSKWKCEGFVFNHTDERIAQFTRLPSEENDLMSIFHYKTRNMIRKSKKSGFDIVVDNSALDILCDLHTDNINVLGGVSKPIDFFKKIPEFFTENTDYKIYVVKFGSEVASILLVFNYGSTVEYYTPAINHKYRSMQPNSLAIFTAMSDACRSGMKIWNWGGTWLNQKEVYNFKKRWGSSEKVYHYYTLVNEKAIYDSSDSKIKEEYPFFYVRPFGFVKNV